MDKEKVVSELKWLKSELLKGGKILEYYQAQADILQRAIQLLEQKREVDKQRCRSVWNNRILELFRV